MILRSGRVIYIKNSVELNNYSMNDLSYVRLDKFDGSTDVVRWLNELDECVKLKGLKENDAASFACYHVKGEAKIELMMMLGNDMINITKLKECLRERYALSRCKSAIIYDIMARKQGESESVNTFIDCLLELGMELRVMEGSWEEVIIESIRNNIRSVELRRSLIGLGKTSIKELRKFSVKWENVGEMISEEVGYKVDVRELGISKVSTLEDRIRHLEISNREYEEKCRELESMISSGSRREVVCYKCGKKGHVARWCRSSLN